MAPPSGHYEHHFSQIFLPKRGKTTLLREICIVLDETWSPYRESPLVYFECVKCCAKGFTLPQMVPQVPTMGIILVKYWFIKGVKPHCYAKYALFLTKLGRPTEIPLVYFECITCYGRGGALYPKWNPQVPTIGIMLTTLLLSQMGNITVPRELCLVHDETVSTYRNSKSVKRCMLSSTLNHVNGAPSAYQGIILRNCPFEKE